VFVSDPTVIVLSYTATPGTAVSVKVSVPSKFLNSAEKRLMGPWPFADGITNPATNSATSTGMTRFFNFLSIIHLHVRQGTVS
jgi:hypothetical protein